VDYSAAPSSTITLILGHESKERTKSPAEIVSGFQKIGCRLGAVESRLDEPPADSVGGGLTVIATGDGLPVSGSARLPASRQRANARGSAGLIERITHRFRW
jgi:hypothetical protein